MLFDDTCLIQNNKIQCPNEVNLDNFEDFDIDLLKPFDKKDLPIILFISGYAAFKTCNKINCENCIDVLISNNTIDYEFAEHCKLIDNLSRGSLKKPTVFAFNTTCICIKIFETLLENFHHSFITNDNQLNLLLILSEPYVSNIINEANQSFLKNCTHNCSAHFQNIIRCTYKILLNNFSKIVNERYAKEKADKRKIRKFT